MNRKMTMRWMTVAMLCAVLSVPAWGQTNVGLTASVTPGKQFDPNERITIQKLNLLGIPTVEISGSVSGALLGTNSIGKQHLLTNVFDGVYLSGGDNVSATIIAGSIDSTRLASNSVYGTNIVSATITATNVATNTLMGLNLVTNAFTNLTLVTPATNDLVLLMDASASNVTASATVSSLRSSVLFEPLWTTNGLSIVAGTQPVLEVAHGLGRAPYMMESWLVCVTNDIGYVVGQRVHGSSVGWNRNEDNQLPFVMMVGSDTNITVIVPAVDGDGVNIMNSSGAPARLSTAINRARWTLTVHAW